MSGTLYLVPTPIGNLGDITLRAVETLALADFVAAEDTRVTGKLLHHLGLKKEQVSYYEHNRAESGEKIIARLLAGENCALCTDAGTPAISDPGEALVALAARSDIPVVPLPGACAVITGLIVSGLPTGRFAFEGFLSTSTKARREHLRLIRQETRTMIFYEAPHKLRATLSDLHDALGDRAVTICRELTKLHEEILRTTLAGAIAHFAEIPPRGEFVLVLAGAEDGGEDTVSLEDAIARAVAYRAEGMSVRDAAATVARETGQPRNALYKALND